MTTTPIFLIEADPDKRYLLSRFLAQNFPGNEIIAVQSNADFSALLFSTSPKIIVSDWKEKEQSEKAEFVSYVVSQAVFPVVIVSLREELRESLLSRGVVAFAETGNSAQIFNAILAALERAPDQQFLQERRSSA